MESKVKKQFDLKQFDIKNIKKNIDKVTELRIKKFIQKLKDENSRLSKFLFSSFNIIIKVSLYWIKRKDLVNLDEHYKQFITGGNEAFYHYIGANGNKYYITDDAVYLANKVLESLLNQSGSEDYDDNRLTSKVRQTEKINGFVNKIFKNEVEQFFHRRPAGKSGYERNLIIRTKSILRGNLTKSQKNFISTNRIKFYHNLDDETVPSINKGFALKKNALKMSEEKLESIQPQVTYLVSLISRKPKVSKPSAEKSTIKITEELSEAEKNKKIDELIHIESKWKVFSGITLVEILLEAAKELKFLRVGVLNEAFKQALYVNQYNPTSLLQTISIQQLVGNYGSTVDFLESEKLKKLLIIGFKSLYQLPNIAYPQYAKIC